MVARILREAWHWAELLDGFESCADNLAGESRPGTRGAPLAQAKRLSRDQVGWTHDPLPSDQISFFQIATSFLSVSMIHRQGAKASPRCGQETAMTTEGSASATRPVRWTIASFTIGQRCRAASASC